MCILRILPDCVLQCSTISSFQTYTWWTAVSLPAAHASITNCAVHFSGLLICIRSILGIVQWKWTSVDYWSWTSYSSHANLITIRQRWVLGDKSHDSNLPIWCHHSQTQSVCCLVYNSPHKSEGESFYRCWFVCVCACVCDHNDEKDCGRICTKLYAKIHRGKGKTKFVFRYDR